MLDSTILSVRNNPEAALLAPVPDALQAWREGDGGSSLRALMAMSSCNKSHVPMSALQYMSLWLEESETPHIWLDHDPMSALDEKQALYAQIGREVADIFETTEPIRPVKTVTMRIPAESPKDIAITGLGRQIDKHVRTTIAAEMGISKNAMKRAKTNAAGEFDPVSRLAIMPGVVGPFVVSVAAATMNAWYYLQEPANPSIPVEVALSTTDSLIMPKQPFEQLLKDYNEDMHQGMLLKIIQLEAA